MGAGKVRTFSVALTKWPDIEGLRVIIFHVSLKMHFSFEIHRQIAQNITIGQYW